MFLILSFFVIATSSAQADINSDSKLLDQYEKQLAQCSENFEKLKINAPIQDSMTKNYYYMMDALAKTRTCYEQLSSKILTEFYDQTPQKAKQRTEEFSSFMYNQYLFVFADTEFCTKNNCGLSVYYNAQYNTTVHALPDYISRMIDSIRYNLKK